MKDKEQIMKQFFSFFMVLVFMSASLISGCASTPQQSEENYNEVLFKCVMSCDDDLVYNGYTDSCTTEFELKYHGYCNEGLRANDSRIFSRSPSISTTRQRFVYSVM